MKTLALIAGFSAATALLAVATPASAQQAAQVSAVNPNSNIVEGPGVKIGRASCRERVSLNV